jgi:hypothetical protein
MAIVKEPSGNNFSEVSSVGNTRITTSSNMRENVPVPTKQQQKALKNFLISRRPSVYPTKNNIHALNYRKY